MLQRRGVFLNAEDLFQDARQGLGGVHHHHLHVGPSLPGRKNTRLLPVYAGNRRVCAGFQDQGFSQGLFSLASS